MPEIVIRNSTISGLHITKNSSHPDVTLLVFPDTTWKDENAMQVAVPSQENLAPETLRLVTWPRNPVSRRYVDQLVQDVAGKKLAMYQPIFVNCSKICLKKVSSHRFQHVQLPRNHDEV